MDAAMMKNQMVVASNTTTTTDCKKMEQDGFSLPQMDTETIVTVTDKIKIELAKAGVDISYFGDSLSAEQLEEISGNAVLAQKPERYSRCRQTCRLLLTILKTVKNLFKKRLSFTSQMTGRLNIC